MALYPLLLEPQLHTRVWGGRRLETLLGHTLPTDEPYGEAWVVHDSTVVVNGALAGRTLGDVLAEYGAALVGAGNDPGQGFPLLAKFLDSNDWLSVQVHPNDEQALELEGEPRGKSEVWYVMDAQPEARLVIGVRSGTSPEGLARAIAENRLEDLLVYANARQGEAVFMPAGTIHALGPGLLVYEMQQSSDQTYRLYDWGRMGLDGKPRQLHIDKGVRVANLDSLPEVNPPLPEGDSVATITENRYFSVKLYDGAANNGQLTFDTGGDNFHVLTNLSGSSAVRTEFDEVIIPAGQSVVVPADTGRYDLRFDGRVIFTQQTR